MPLFKVIVPPISCDKCQVSAPLLLPFHSFCVWNPRCHTMWFVCSFKMFWMDADSAVPRGRKVRYMKYSSKTGYPDSLRFLQEWFHCQWNAPPHIHETFLEGRVGQIAKCQITFHQFSRASCTSFTVSSFFWCTWSAWSFLFFQICAHPSLGS